MDEEEQDTPAQHLAEMDRRPEVSKTYTDRIEELKDVIRRQHAMLMGFPGSNQWHMYRVSKTKADAEKILNNKFW
jgi:hypothetical protein